MTKEKLLSVLAIYEMYFANLGAKSEMIKNGNSDPSAIERNNHLYSMCIRAKNLVKIGKKEKAFRWLGFIQGVLWSRRIFTLEELREHNRPKKEEGITTKRYELVDKFKKRKKKKTKKKMNIPTISSNARKSVPER